MKRINALLFTFLAAGLLLHTTGIVAAAQKQKFAHAIERSNDAGRIINILASIDDSGFPRELVDKAKAVAVFPKVEKQTSLFSTVTHGYGVISARDGEGWTSPAFYAFGGGGFGSPFAKDVAFGVIFLFMTDKALSEFESGGFKLKEGNETLPGPVTSSLTDEQRKRSKALTSSLTRTSTESSKVMTLVKVS